MIPWIELCLMAGAMLLQDAQIGLNNVDPRWHALTHARVIVAPGETLEDCTVVVRDGVILQVSEHGAVPAGAREWNCTGLTVCAGFLEPVLPVAVAASAPVSSPGIYAARRAGPAAVDAALREALRKLGFTTAAVVPDRGLLRGVAALVSMHARKPCLIAPDRYQLMTFESAGFGEDTSGERAGWPNSQMGAIAQLRQTFLDVDWHQQCLAVYERNPSGHAPPVPRADLEDLARQRAQGVPLWFRAENDLEALRAAKIAEEFGWQLRILGSGTEYRRVEPLAALHVPFVVPLNFPEVPEMQSPSQAESIPLRSLMEWETAPTNLLRLERSGMTLALTSDRLSDRAEFFNALRKVIDLGFDGTKALAFLTTEPAKLLGVDDRLGALREGYLAQILVYSGEPFAEKSELREVWVDGDRHELVAPPDPRLGRFELVAESGAPGPSLQATIEKDKVVVAAGDQKHDAERVQRDPERIRFLVKDLGDPPALAAFSLFIDKDGGHGVEEVSGVQRPLTVRRLPDEAAAPSDTPKAESKETAASETAVSEAAGKEPGGAEPETKVAEESPDDSSAEPKNKESRRGPRPSDRKIDPFAPLPMPFSPFGFDVPPAKKSWLVEHATVWTAGSAGIIEDGTIAVRDGVIAYAGPSSSAPDPAGFEVIDGRGKHVTPGLIDCHSHTGVHGSVNETAQRVTAEVRIFDVINPDDLNWYHQLAGGLTAANQLHGSANAIGGQNSVVKLRFGSAHPDAMRLTGAAPGIKFALGENPKRVAADTTRPEEYPQTRMGVEALIVDRLAAGRDDRKEHARYATLSEWEKRDRMPPRRDLELEALGEIVAGERLVHCHSYRQDEILMLCRVARDFGFKLGTFQHVLEGYKVAEAIKEAALGGSTFADWWAYKFEVIDAIPHNAALMSQVGVSVSINSDSDEHARRLNTEAGKAKKYGGLDRHEALKLVTWQPAVQLMISDRVGSLEVGKDADFAIWSADPLSTYSVCEATFIEGRQYFSIERHRDCLEKARSERARLVEKALSSEATSRPGRARGRGANPTAADLAGVLEEWYSGAESGHRQGECGCYQTGESR